MKKFLRLTFTVKDNYDERELEGLLETLEIRGALYSHIKGPSYSVYVREDMDYMPFYTTIAKCSSVEIDSKAYHVYLGDAEISA